MEKFMSQQFPTFKPLNTGYQAESSSRTITEEKTIEKQDELNDAPLPDSLPDQSKVEVHQEADVIDSTCITGIARRKAVARPARTATAFIHIETVKSPEPRPATAEIEYAGRPMIDENMRMFIDNCLKKYTDNTAWYCLVPLGTGRFLLVDYLGTAQYCSVPLDTARFLLADYLRGDIIYSAGNIHIFRSQIDELLTNQYLDNNHIDALAILLAEKSKLCPTLYQPFIHVSSMYWINHLHEETGDYFESDIRSWPLTIVSGVPTQKNGFDFRMFVYKYMENTILAHPLKWEELSHWQDEMPKLRAELAYAILCQLQMHLQLDAMVGIELHFLNHRVLFQQELNPLHPYDVLAHDNVAIGSSN
ncbi:hypothetical protein IEQ34_017460 [Dendrobium chrysotoxum]|uniref:Uncharacterized protein n=1 Tax=Dendrobium chrysotoxum TaxID=161865 RepID=A0AAV7G9J4_DENCH|nr:hypothetical protein IEQ34_017460 [Dendrobium chrysotoxum]